MNEKITITNQYGLKMNVERFFSSSSAKKRDKANNKGLVLLCTIDSGRLVLGGRVKINLPENTLEDKVVRIEENHLPLRTADPGQSIGICLEKETEEHLLLLLSQPCSRQ